jgi:P27 family predicted phage terminase small subunit
MGVRGPKPKPEGFKVLEGRSHQKKTTPLIVPLADYSEIFKYLNGADLPEPVLEQTRKTLRILEEKKILGVCDILAFERYCQHLRIAYEADATLKSDGLFTYDANGVLHKHPANQVHRDNSIAALRYEEQFGLTPSARMRLTKTDDEQKEDDYGEFRKRPTAG